ncbi:rhodanese-like domain-containing protein [Enterococcus dongliensis]|uniref:sulfurtransferase n=1 Tax=Enterococcus dongliensis TaxID=2559925 RepID=UPI00288DB6FE|nr:rhodanese-like domain-containing protein [Enterococcus dongliensis]MDT2640394.1 rhodanese-like domain-containing protein [Enterococcus dongliensis]
MKKIMAVISCLLLTALVVYSKTEEVHAADKSTKVQRLVKSKDIKADDFFVDAKWLKKQMKNDDKTVVIEASYGEGKEYKKAHVPGAFHVDTMEIETEENNWNILDAETCKEVFLKRGVTKTTPVVVYSSDINAAARMAFVAYWLGVDQVKILDGGLAAWEKADYKVEKGTEKAKAATDFGAEVPGRPESLISTSADVVAAKEKNPDLVLASVRSWKEFTGKTSGYDYIKNAGEPEGAVYAKASKTSADVARLVNSDGTVKEPTKIFADWAKWGITPDKEVAFYCGTGWRAATTFFITKQEGWKDVKLFDGGWYDWDKAHQKDPSKYPVQIGDPRDKDNLEILD